ncbi:putative Chorion peroxidase [Hypsibius exemplaris]|uniref:Chorion peroxidase n=1 Tax=Hypsibius exemplaris TaxID=2072580 RepID=A0A1W0WYT2_HYPEX|nr:putative Chorion peroxidase [Hypsibius exemplaris]
MLVVGTQMAAASRTDHCKPVSPIADPSSHIHPARIARKLASTERRTDPVMTSRSLITEWLARQPVDLVPNRYASTLYRVCGPTGSTDGHITISQSVHAEDKHVSQLFVTFASLSTSLTFTVAEDDPFYSHYDVTCLEFVASLSTTTDKACGVGLRMQINQNSHWLDGSNVLRFRQSLSGPPRRERAYEDYLSEANRTFDPICLDVVRHHTHLLQSIGEARDDYSDDQIYQLARRILLAQYQFVVFNELLPEIIGSKRMMLYELQPLNDTHHLPASKYVAGQGKILLEFSTAAGRFGHSLLGDDIFKAASKPFKLSDHLNRVDLALASPDDVGDLLHSASQHPALQMDQHITGEVQNKLFKKANPYGGDLFASNIQRGRDHGIGTYYDVRKFCLGDVSVDPSWSSPVWEGVFHKGSLNSLKRLYRSPLDVDLFAGGIAESIETAGQGVVGPTFGCVIAKQFQQLKFGDRFWFEFGKTMVSGDSQFTGAELAEIRKTSLARLMCDETTITSVTKRVLRLSKDTVQCDDPDFLAETGVDYNVFIPNAAF